MVKPPNPPYLGPAAHTSGPGNKPITRIVMHSTVSPCVPGAARVTAAYFRSDASSGSAHYVVDPSEVVQVVYDDEIAWHAPPNAHSIGVEMCDIPTTVNALRWATPGHIAMLRRAANLVARLCAAYDVPPVFLTHQDLVRGRSGITTHHQVTLAFHQSTHWDPGLWPRKVFLGMVQRRYNKLKGVVK